MSISKTLRKLVRKSLGDSGDPSRLIPPMELIDGIGGGGEAAFVEVGREFFRHLVDKGGLRPTDRVLDVGCGCGRIAVALLPYLQAPGEYWGFDIVRPAVLWAQSHIASRQPNFHFDTIDVYNRQYNRRGKIPPEQYRFACASDFFDFTFLTSVFTHLLAPDMRQYLREIARTLKPGGRCLVTYYILNAESRVLMDKAKASISFAHPYPDCMVQFADIPEAAVAFEESFIRQCFAECGLDIVEPIHFGQWCGREKFLSHQDVIIATKR